MITLISNVYNEEFILPFFLEHYNNEVDRMIIFLDQDTTDNSPSILARYPKVEVRPLYFEEGHDDIVRDRIIHQAYQELEEGWVILADSDEFVFHKEYSLNHAINKAEKLGFNVLCSDMGTPFRHHSEKDLDSIVKPIWSQRRYGIQYFYDRQFYKPILAKAGLNVTWQVGRHHIDGDFRQAPYALNGAHWCFADPIIMQQRFLRREARRAPINKAMGWGTNYKDYTPDTYLTFLKEHENDPLLF